MYNYFISFRVADGGFGNQGYQRSEKIKGIEDVKEISRDLEKTLGLEEKSLVIMNFQLFD